MSITNFSSTMIMNATKTSTIADDYDHLGAAIYIAGIIIFYSTGLVLMLFFHVRPRRFQHQFIFDHEGMDGSTGSLNNPVRRYHHVQTNDMRKQILNELKDPKRREQLWKIYYSSREKQNEPHEKYYQTVALDSATIGLINKRLATLHRMASKDGPNADLITSSNKTPKILSKSLHSVRRLSAVLTKPSIIRLHSGSKTPQDTTSEEADSVFDENPVEVISSSNTCILRNEGSNRFTVERVTVSLPADSK